MNEKSLKKLGLTSNMSRIYLAVLQSLSPIRSVDLFKNTKLTKSSFYDALHELEDRGIVAKIGDGHDSGYTANDPQVFIQEAQTRQVYAEDMAQQITSSYVGKLTAEERAMTIFSREKELPAIFKSVRKSPIGKEYAFYDKYLLDHITLDSKDGGHADMVSSFPIDEGVLKEYYEKRFKLYQSAFD